MNEKNKVSQLINGGKKSGKLVVKTKEKIDILIGEAERLLTEAKDKAGNIAHQGKKKI